MKEGKCFEMAIKIHLRRFTSLLLCCLLVFCSVPVEAFATDPVTAASLAITGGQLAGAGLSGEAALSLAGPVGAVVGVTLGALGINAYVSKAAQEAGKTRTRFVLDKLVIWAAQAGYTQEQLYSKIAQGIAVAADGTIQLGKDTAKIIEQFGNWLFTQEDTVIPSITQSGNVSANFGGVTYNAFTAGGWTENTGYTMIWQSTVPCFVLYSGQLLQFVTLESGKVVLYGHSSPSKTLNLDISEKSSYGQTVYYAGITGSSLRKATVEPLTASINADQFVASFRGVGAFETAPAADEVFTGTPDAWVDNRDVLNPSAEDTPVVLNPDLLNPIIDSLADGRQATMSIIDYLQALQDAWDHALDDVQTAIGTITDTLTGIQEQIAVPQTAVENPTITNPSVTPDTTPVVDPSTVDPGTVVTGLSFDLTNIFPFCIPFDIYAALDLLDAEPVAPSYHFHLEWPYNIVIDFTLDLSPFNQVAAVARTMEILIFLIGLAVMTRSMFIRG